ASFCSVGIFIAAMRRSKRAWRECRRRGPPVSWMTYRRRVTPPRLKGSSRRAREAGSRILIEVGANTGKNRIVKQPKHVLIVRGEEPAMSNQNNSRPAAPVLVVKDQEVVGISLFLLLPAILASVVFNGGLMILLYFIFQGFAGSATAMETVKVDTVVNAEPADEKPNRDPFLTSDIDPAAQEYDTDIQ